MTQLVVGSPKNHIALRRSNFFIANWPCCLMLFGQAALFRKRDVNFPEEGAERSRPPKGHPPIPPGGLARARGRPGGLPAWLSWIPLLTESNRKGGLATEPTEPHMSTYKYVQIRTNTCSSTWTELPAQELRGARGHVPAMPFTQVAHRSGFCCLDQQGGQTQHLVTRKRRLNGR